LPFDSRSECWPAQSSSLNAILPPLFPDPSAASRYSLFRFYFFRKLVAFMRREGLA